MLRRLAHVLIALIVALSATMPSGARGMPMAVAATDMAVHHGCQTCPHDQTGSNPATMLACQVLACSSAVAVLPIPALLPERLLLRAAYLMAGPVRWAGTQRTPDPFPPRPIALA